MLYYLGKAHLQKISIGIAVFHLSFLAHSYTINLTNSMCIFCHHTTIYHNTELMLHGVFNVIRMLIVSESSPFLFYVTTAKQRDFGPVRQNSPVSLSRFLVSMSFSLVKYFQHLLVR